MKEEILKLYRVNGVKIRMVINQYRERNDCKGLAEFFKAFLNDLAEVIDEPLKETFAPPKGTGHAPNLTVPKE